MPNVLYSGPIGVSSQGGLLVHAEQECSGLEEEKHIGSAVVDHRAFVEQDCHTGGLVVAHMSIAQEVVRIAVMVDFDHIVLEEESDHTVAG